MRIDHIVVGATDIAAGLDQVKDQTGLDVPPGGQHLQMGTHNHLAQLSVSGQSETAYFEIIAPDPALNRPDYARWFSFDDPAHQARIAARPGPVAWVLAVDDMAGLLNSLPGDLRETLGRPFAMTRGDLSWTICLREDGLLPDGGVLPLLIEWPDGNGPAMHMPDIGISLQRLVLQHPDVKALQHNLTLLGIDPDASPLLDIREGDKSLDFQLLA